MIYVLEELFKQDKAHNTEAFNSRIHRALNWFKKAVLLETEPEFQLISLSIAWNAICTDSTSAQQAEMMMQNLEEILSRILLQDDTHKITHLVQHKLKSDIDCILRYPYAHPAYWAYKNTHIDQVTWQQQWSAEQQRIQALQSQSNIQPLLLITLERIFQFNQQMLIGGYHYHSQLHQKMLESSNLVLIHITAVVLEMLIVHAPAWQHLKPHYPAVTLC